MSNRFLIQWQHSVRSIKRDLADALRMHRLIAILIAVSLLLRGLATGFVPLIPQEAYYWVYAQHPSLSYYDHPPMVAWMIGLGTFLLGTNEFGVRCVNAVAVFAACGLMYRFSRCWFDRRTAFASAIVLLTLPVFFAIGLIATMDGILLFFWLLALIGFTLAVKLGRVSGWYLFGAAVGAGLLSKYTAVFLPVGAVLSLVLHRPWRKQLLNPHLAVSLVLAGGIFVPVIWWNADHDWASFRFQLLGRFAKPDHGKTVLGFVTEQLVVATPLLLFGVGAVFFRAIQRRRLTAAEVVALAFGFPLLLVTGEKSLHSFVHINWTLPAYLSLLPVATHYFTAVSIRLRRKRRTGPSALNGGIFFGTSINIALMLFILILQPMFHCVEWFGPWDDLANRVDRVEEMQERKDGQDPLVIVNGSFELASEIDFYRAKNEGREPPEPKQRFVDPDFITSQWILGGEGLGYRYWDGLQTCCGKTCLFIDDHDGIEKRAAGHFSSIQTVWSGKARNTVNYRIAICRGFCATDIPQSTHP